MNYSQHHRSRIYHLITNLHVPDEIRLARLDCWGVFFSGLLVALLAEFARLLTR